MQEPEQVEVVPGGVSVDEDPDAGDVFILPASLEQHRYWILDQVDKHSTASNMAIAFHLEGEIQDSLAEKAIRDLTLRHEALRTTYRMVDGALSQIISQKPLYDFAVSDLRAIPEGQKRQRAEDVILDHSHVQMDLAEGPVFFARLIHLSDHEHFLAITVHHIACDGWSNGVLVRDFAEMYTAMIQHREPNLAELPFQFADFAVWQKQWLESEDAQAALEFWKEQIQRGTPAVDLPTDIPRNARKDGPGHIESQLLPASLHTALRAYCRRREATMHQVLLAAFQALVARYTGQSQFLLGSSIANRTQMGMDDVVGRFANPQVIVADVDKNPSFHELVRRVIDWSAKSYAHQDLPFSRLMEEFQLDQAGATSQFLQVYFVYQKAFMQPQKAGDLMIVPRPSVSGGVNFDFLVSIVERAEGPRVQIEYNTDLFRRERIVHFIDRYVRVLQAVMENDALAVSEIPLLSPDEDYALRKVGRGSPLSEESEASLIEAFDRQVELRGGATAVVAGSQRTTWKQLSDRSRVFAQALQNNGVRAGQYVALRMEPIADVAAAVLAILRLRAIVLPIPGGTTENEWDRILLALQPHVALASDGFSGKTTATLHFEHLKPSGTPSFDSRPPSASDAAWAGVTIDSNEHFKVFPTTHGTSFKRLRGAAQALHLRSGDAVALLRARTCADAWTDIMLPLVNGAGIVFASAAKAEHLQELIDREQAGFAFGSPSEWLGLLGEGWLGDRRLNIVCRGERLPGSIVRRLQNAGQLWSMLSSHLVGGAAGLATVPRDSVGGDWPIAPLPGLSFKILDDWGNTAPGEVPGDLTVVDSDVQTRTGYLARYSTAFGFELMGSVLGVVRMHNYRLRLGELEDRLLSHPSVDAARACLLNDANGSPELVAFVAGNNGKLPSEESLRQFLRASSPGHLASAEIVPLASIHERLDGTPDQLLMPRPERKQSAHLNPDDYTPPRDELESKIVKVWEEVLGVKGIGTRTSFFSLGGYSLMIVRLFARMNKLLGTSLPITTIFNAPTVEQLADIVRGRRNYSPVVLVQKGASKPPFFLLHSYLLYGGLPSVIGKDYPFYGLCELETDGDMTIQERIATYIEQIRTVQPNGPYYIGGWCAAGPLAVEAARQLVAQGEKVGRLVLFDSWRPGYTDDLAADQATRSTMTFRAKLNRKYTYHSRRLMALSAAGRWRYLMVSATHKIRSMRDHFYMRNWAAVQWLFKRFGLALPDFMNNISLNTLNTVRLYRTEPFNCPMTLLRATDTQPIAGADAACGWSDVATEPVEVLWAPGNHESMFMEPNLTVVGKMVRECLERGYKQAT